MPDAEHRLLDVRARIARAAKAAARDERAVTLVAVTKTHPAAAITPLIACGQREFAENRVQEAQAKWLSLRRQHQDIHLHLVGQLQSNKAAEAAALFDVIHSIDRPSLIAALAKLDIRRDCFVQVNLEGARGKGGCAPGDLGAILAQAGAARLPVVGLMCVPPEGLEPAPWFALLARLARDHGLPALSMGMSGDYETAVMLGATHVRIGSALFGERK